MQDKDKDSFRYGRKKKVKVVVTPVYVGKKPMEDVIGEAVIDSYQRKQEGDAENAKDSA